MDRHIIGCLRRRGPSLQRSLPSGAKRIALPGGMRSFFPSFSSTTRLVQSRFGEHDLSGYASHIGNVRAALQWAFSDDGDVTVGVELAAWAAPLFIGLSLLEECSRWCERALAGLDDAARGTRQEMILQEALHCLRCTPRETAIRFAPRLSVDLLLRRRSGTVRANCAFLSACISFSMRLGDFRGALAVAERGAAIAEAARHQAGPSAEFLLGMLTILSATKPRRNFIVERAMARAAEPGTLNPNFFGFDHRIYAPISLARALWLRGFADRARRIAQKRHR